MSDNKLLLGMAVVAALGVGGVAGAALGGPSIALAQDDRGTTATENDDGATAEDGCEGRGVGRHGFGWGANLDVAAEALGIPEDELRDALRDGSTIAEVAREESVDVQIVIDDLVAGATARIDDAVADGDLEQRDADEIQEDLTDRVTDFVNGEHSFAGPDGGHRGFRGGPLDRR